MTVINLTERQRRWREIDAANTRIKIAGAITRVSELYDETKVTVAELRADGGYVAAIAALVEAQWRLKQAETLLERAKGLVK